MNPSQKKPNNLSGKSTSKKRTFFEICKAIKKNTRLWLVAIAAFVAGLSAFVSNMETLTDYYNKNNNSKIANQDEKKGVTELIKLLKYRQELVSAKFDKIIDEATDLEKIQFMKKIKIEVLDLSTKNIKALEDGDFLISREITRDLHDFLNNEKLNDHFRKKKYRGWGVNDLDPTNKNSAIRTTIKKLEHDKTKTSSKTNINPTANDDNKLPINIMFDSIPQDLKNQFEKKYPEVLLFTNDE